MSIVDLMKNKYKPGDLVENVKQQYSFKLGILISQDNIHPKFWKVLKDDSIENWYELNFKKVTLHDNGPKISY